MNIPLAEYADSQGSSRVRLRRAVPGDELAFLYIKSQLPLVGADKTSTGGFLLGTDAQTYLRYIQTAHCLVSEFEGRIVGFGIILPDSLLRASDVWVRRYSANWDIDLPTYENQVLCYFEQFAFLKGHKRSAVALAYNLVKQAFEQGAEYLFTTTVNKPVLNLAAIPFIKAVKGIRGGTIDETYPLVGPINSDIWIVSARTYEEQVQAHPLYPFLVANTIRNV